MSDIWCDKQAFPMSSQFMNSRSSLPPHKSNLSSVSSSNTNEDYCERGDSYSENYSKQIGAGSKIVVKETAKPLPPPKPPKLPYNIKNQTRGGEVAEGFAQRTSFESEIATTNDGSVSGDSDGDGLQISSAEASSVKLKFNQDLSMFPSFSSVSGSQEPEMGSLGNSVPVMSGYFERLKLRSVGNSETAAAAAAAAEKITYRHSTPKFSTGSESWFDAHVTPRPMSFPADMKAITAELSKEPSLSDLHLKLHWQRPVGQEQQQQQPQHRPDDVTSTSRTSTSVASGFSSLEPVAEDDIQVTPMPVPQMSSQLLAQQAMLLQQQKQRQKQLEERQYENQPSPISRQQEQLQHQHQRHSAEYSEHLGSFHSNSNDFESQEGYDSHRSGQFSPDETSSVPSVVSSFDGFVYKVQTKRNHRNFLRGSTVDRPLQAGDFVIVEADRGEDLGVVCEVQEMPAFFRQGGSLFAKDSKMVSWGDKQSGVKHILRHACPQEYSLLPVKLAEEQSIVEICRERANGVYLLPLVVVDAEYQFDRHKLTIYYESNRRIDFRELVRDLFSIYKTRIWMEHVSYSFRPNEIASQELMSGIYQSIPNVLLAPSHVAPSHVHHLPTQALPYAMMNQQPTREIQFARGMTTPVDSSRGYQVPLVQYAQRQTYRPVPAVGGGYGKYSTSTEYHEDAVIPLPPQTTYPMTPLQSLSPYDRSNNGMSGGSEYGRYYGNPQHYQPYQTLDPSFHNQQIHPQQHRNNSHQAYVYRGYKPSGGY